MQIERLEHVNRKLGGLSNGGHGRSGHGAAGDLSDDDDDDLALLKLKLPSTSSRAASMESLSNKNDAASSP